MFNTLYTITLADGTVLTNLRKNGDNFISTTPLFSSTFEYNLSTVLISDGENTQEYHNLELVHLTKMEMLNNDYWFAFRELSEKEIADAKLRADVDYLYMMTGIE